MTTDEYLKQLRRAARGLPRARRKELVAEIDEHLREALPPGAGDAAVRTELDRLGPPDEIVAAEGGRQPAGGWFEWIGLGLLLLGSAILPVVGWLIGAVMLWVSHVWTWRQKLAGTLLVPGGLGGIVILAFVVGGSSRSCTGGAPVGHPIVLHCTGGGWPVSAVIAIPLLVVWAIVPIVMTVYLGRRVTPAR